jgi:hypothetical protein
VRSTLTSVVKIIPIINILLIVISIRLGVFRPYRVSTVAKYDLGVNTAVYSRSVLTGSGFSNNQALYFRRAQSMVRIGILRKYTIICFDLHPYRPRKAIAVNCLEGGLLKACTSNYCSILFISENGYYWKSPQVSQPIIRYLQEEGVVLLQLCNNSRAEGKEVF